MRKGKTYTTIALCSAATCLSLACAEQSSTSIERDPSLDAVHADVVAHAERVTAEAVVDLSEALPPMSAPAVPEGWMQVSDVPGIERHEPDEEVAPEELLEAPKPPKKPNGPNADGSSGAGPKAKGAPSDPAR